MPRSNESCRRASITAAQSTLLGQRVVHVWHETHCQMELARSARIAVAELQQADQARRRNIHMRRDGHPAVHLPHW